MFFRLGVSSILTAVLALGGRAQVNSLSSHEAEQVDAIVQAVLTASGVPSASLAVVTNGKVVFEGAYGHARIGPARDAQPSMRYSVGSISKQFTAAAVLLLKEDGKLGLDDPIAKYFPALTRASEVTIRMLLSHTSGYSDFWPEDYVMESMRQPTTAARIMDQWAKRPLDFDPGTKWQYSNTNYVIAGQIVEKVSGKPLFTVLQERVFGPLEMKSVYDIDRARLPESDAEGYYRHALGPLRPAPKEGQGWLTAAGELAMTPDDLARWDISLINRSLLKPASYAEMFKEVHTKNREGTHYALGLAVSSQSGHTVLEHSGEVSGFVAENLVIPDAKSAVVVLTNQDASEAASQIAREIRPLLIGRSKEEERALKIFTGLQNGHLDRSLFTGACNAYFDQQAMDDFASSLKPLGEPLGLIKEHESQRGGMTFRLFRVYFAARDLTVSTYEMPDGKFEQYLVLPRER
jgi:CubicO group peptidase (beta-lactamase class C family)